MYRANSTRAERTGKEYSICEVSFSSKTPRKGGAQDTLDTREISPAMS